MNTFMRTNPSNHPGTVEETNYPRDQQSSRPVPSSSKPPYSNESRSELFTNVVDTITRDVRASSLDSANIPGDPIDYDRRRTFLQGQEERPHQVIHLVHDIHENPAAMVVFMNNAKSKNIKDVVQDMRWYGTNVTTHALPQVRRDKDYLFMIELRTNSEDVHTHARVCLRRNSKGILKVYGPFVQNTDEMLFDQEVFESMVASILNLGLAGSQDAEEICVCNIPRGAASLFFNLGFQTMSGESTLPVPTEGGLGQTDPSTETFKLRLTLSSKEQ